MSLKIIIPGPLSTIQDFGFKGHMSEGFPQCGVMDPDAMAISNILVGNKQSEAVIEMTMRGISAQVSEPCAVALAGGDAVLYINGNASYSYKAYELSAGDFITVGQMKSGCRAYLAISGGFDIPEIMKSKSTNLKAGIGGFKGRALKSGDILPTKKDYIPLSNMEKRIFYPYGHSKSTTLRAVSGPQADYFSAGTSQIFFSSEYKISPNSDRMGIRLEGISLESLSGTDIISDGIAPGSVQVPKNGLPIILCSDRQTTGGYAKIATVISADLSKTAQLLPGDKITFKRVSPDEAYDIFIKRKNKLDKLDEILNNI